MTSNLNSDLQNVLKGIIKASDVIVSTYGGSGKNVIIADNRDLKFTKDGVSVAKSIILDDNEENIGARLLINAANKTVEECGDGTTLTSLFVKRFAEEIFNTKPDDINKFIDEVKEAINIVITNLKETSKQIDSAEDIYNIALTSSKSERVARLISDIYKKTGHGAYINVEMSTQSSDTFYETTDGLQFDTGFIHPGFVNQQNGTCSFDNTYVFILEENITSPDDFTDIITEVYNRDNAILFMAPSYSDAFVRFCLTNIKQKGLKICLVKTPGYGHYQKENIKDIRTFIDDDGRCNKVTISPYDITFFNNPDKQKIKNRTENLKRLAENSREKYDEQDYLNRINNLQQTSAIIFVGGVTEKNAKEEFDRIEDAVGAVKASLQLGYVRGSGVELANMDTTNLPQSELMSKILKSPYYQILMNGNSSNNIIEQTPFNLKTKKYDNNLIDPAKVVISALTNSFALIELLINTSYIVYNE